MDTDINAGSCIDIVTGKKQKKESHRDRERDGYRQVSRCIYNLTADTDTHIDTYRHNACKHNYKRAYRDSYRYRFRSRRRSGLKHKYKYKYRCRYANIHIEIDTDKHEDTDINVYICKLNIDIDTDIRHRRV